MQLLGQGMQLAGVARELGISENSAKTHIARAMVTLGAATRTEAVLKHSRTHRTWCRRGDDAAVAAETTR